jgi:hypothetical protein
MAAVTTAIARRSMTPMTYCCAGLTVILLALETEAQNRAAKPRWHLPATYRPPLASFDKAR